MASTPPQTEKPFHYTYLKEFRVNQCPLFLQHKCTQHRPFTCFHWHFSNQRRRRPVRKRDGTFNYSADVYCSKYDETTGICPDGDDCPYIHRNTGDTERRYHLRYYKTGTCIHETDSRGNCVKNGPHCAFAHGANDLRPPVYDIREQQGNEQAQHEQASNSSESSSQETINLSEKIVNEDPKWQDANYVLANYKTEVCKRPPRLCRQGYACPQYHNAKDRRRNPKKFKYRSSPCPNVKQGDDWKDPSACEKGDNCQFCHTRTEQQFHPEIYKSTKCHDMTQTGYCPRGPFCAFAHVEQEIRIVEDSPAVMENNLGGIGEPGRSYVSDQTAEGVGNYAWSEFARNFSKDNAEYGRSLPSQSFINDYNLSRSFPTCPSPISKPRSTSLSNGKGDNYSKAPGSERNLSDISSLQNLNSSLAWTMQGIGLQAKRNSLNSDAVPFYPPDETVDSVVGNALDDLDLDDNNDKSEVKSIPTNLWQHTISSADSFAPASLYSMSDPVNIPHDALREFARNPMPSVSPTSLSNAFGADLHNPSAMSSGTFPSSHFQSMPTPGSLGTPGSLPGSIMSTSLGSGIITNMDFERMQQKCKQWEESWNQAKIACDAWKREATEANERARVSEERCNVALERCRILESQLRSALEHDASDSVGQCSHLHMVQDKDDLSKMPLSKLNELQHKFKTDLALIEKFIWELVWQSQQQQ